jgi:hypothetical protein
VRPQRTRVGNEGIAADNDPTMPKPAHILRQRLSWALAAIALAAVIGFVAGHA